jgi:hypothetical protein
MEKKENLFTKEEENIISKLFEILFGNTSKDIHVPTLPPKETSV